MSHPSRTIATLILIIGLFVLAILTMPKWNPDYTQTFTQSSNGLPRDRANAWGSLVPRAHPLQRHSNNQQKPQRRNNTMASEKWQTKAGQNPKGGLNAAGRASYNKAHGGHLKAPAPNPKTKAESGRKASFCARMKGLKSKLTSAKTAKDPNSRVNKSLRAWRCN